jgi:hypothetical protein
VPAPEPAEPFRSIDEQLLRVLAERISASANGANLAADPRHLSADTVRELLAVVDSLTRRELARRR